MFVIMVYDVNQKRVAKMLKTSRQYFNWIQNSVFEGEITEGHLERYKSDVKKIIKDNDSVIIFKFDSTKYYKKEVIGKERSEITNIL